MEEKARNSSFEGSILCSWPVLPYLQLIVLDLPTHSSSFYASDGTGQAVSSLSTAHIFQFHPHIRG
jgi:hypothetical protein